MHLITVCQYWQKDKKKKLRNAFNNKTSTDLTLCKDQISKAIRSGRFLGLLLSKLASPLTKVAILLAKNVLAPLRTAAASAIDAGIQKKIHGSGRLSSTILIISNREMNNIMKIV